MEDRVRHHRGRGCASVSVREDRSGRSEEHAHVSLTLGRIDDGARELVTPGRRWRLAAGDGFVIPPDAAHAWETAGVSAYRVISIDPVRFLPPPWDIAVFADARWAAAFDAAHRAVEADDPGLEPRLAALLAATDAETPRIAPPVLAGAVRKARRLATNHLDERQALAQLGAEVGLSPFHLHRLYHRAWGLTPAQHRLLARLREARRLLADGASVADAAAATGFADQGHLCRAFRKTMGVPPSVWVKQIGRSHASG